MEYSEQLNQLHEQYGTISSGTAKRDLYKLWKNCVNLYTELSKEAVNCHRLQKVTSKYESLEEQLKAGIETLEQHITFAKLLY